MENLNDVIISMVLLINVQKFNKWFATVAYIVAIIDNLVGHSLSLLRFNRISDCSSRIHQCNNYDTAELLDHSIGSLH